jgi:hypothetical protein
MAFEKDLGYLDKFFDALEEHSAGLDDRSGARLVALLGEERVRWQEIRSLLAGGSSARSDEEAPIGTNGPGSGAELDVLPAARPAPQAPAGARFTVGSLRGESV